MIGVVSDFRVDLGRELDFNFASTNQLLHDGQGVLKVTKGGPAGVQRD